MQQIDQPLDFEIFIMFIIKTIGRKNICELLTTLGSLWKRKKKKEKKPINFKVQNF